MAESIITKTCVKCKVEKPRNEFYVSPQHTDGLSYKCKDCIREYGRQRYVPVMSIKKKLPTCIKFCKCGCGEQIIIKEFHRWYGVPDYIFGHHSRICNPMKGVHLLPSEATREKMRKARIGKPPIMEGKRHTEEAKKKIAIALTKRWEANEYRIKMKSMAKKKWEDIEYKKCQLDHIKRRTEKRKANNEDHPLLGFKHSKETRDNMRKAHIGLIETEETKLKKSLAITGIKRSEKTKALISEIARKRYLDPVYVKKMATAWNIKPNKPEKLILNLLNELYPGQWKYTGDFSFTINGKCPDFVNCNGQKKCIEFNGTYWHKDDIPGEREKIFAEFGYKTLIIWESEMQDWDSVIKKIQNFERA